MNDGGGVGPDGLGCDLRGGCEIRTREAARRGMPFDIMDDDDDDIGCGGVRDSVLSSSAITSSVSSRDVAIRGRARFYRKFIHMRSDHSASSRALRFLNDVLEKNFGQFELDAW